MKLTPLGSGGQTLHLQFAFYMPWISVYNKCFLRFAYLSICVQICVQWSHVPKLITLWWQSTCQHWFLEDSRLIHTQRWFVCFSRVLQSKSRKHLSLVSIYVVRIASTCLRTCFLNCPGMLWFPCRSNDRKNWSLTRNTCCRYVESFEIDFGT